jgi:hypothetical protein
MMDLVNYKTVTLEDAHVRLQVFIPVYHLNRIAELERDLVSRDSLLDKYNDDNEKLNRELAEAKEAAGWTLVSHLEHQREWSSKTFGPGPRAEGIVDHITKELAEIQQAPTDLTEWIDVVILALDGSWRSGHSPEEIVSALRAKQLKNESRTWPDWRTEPTDKAICHINPPAQEPKP